jgi:hypothetical protein
MVSEATVAPVGDTACERSQSQQLGAMAAVIPA